MAGRRTPSNHGGRSSPSMVVGNECDNATGAPTDDIKSGSDDHHYGDATVAPLPADVVTRRYMTLLNAYHRAIDDNTMTSSSSSASTAVSPLPLSRASVMACMRRLGLLHSQYLFSEKLARDHMNHMIDLAQVRIVACTASSSLWHLMLL
jgi:hypothetical protein